jgi:hypothetical protein
MSSLSNKLLLCSSCNSGIFSHLFHIKLMRVKCARSVRKTFRVTAQHLKMQRCSEVVRLAQEIQETKGRQWRAGQVHA